MVNFQDALISLRDFDIAQLNDFERIDSWPVAVKIVIWLLVFMGMLAVGYFVHITDLQEALMDVQQTEMILKKDYVKKHFAAAYLDAYLQRQSEMEKTFATLLPQLPHDTEIPDLIEDITLMGLNRGLAFTSIDLQPDLHHEFYIEKPIKIQVTGDYHALGLFVSDVADLPRIVTLHDFQIAPIRDDLSRTNQATNSLLRMNILAKTYHYNQDEFNGSPGLMEK